MIDSRPVHLVAIDAANRAIALGLTPKSAQQHFIATNEDSLRQAAQNQSCVPLLILAGSQPVGFAMYALDPDDGNYWIYRLMIDGDYQGRGYGTAALNALTAQIFQTTSCPLIMLGVQPENLMARRLYERAGFREAGFEIDGETILCLQRPGA
jgi:diamine N-acetyltransferase